MTSVRNIYELRKSHMYHDESYVENVHVHRMTQPLQQPLPWSASIKSQLLWLKTPLTRGVKAGVRVSQLLTRSMQEPFKIHKVERRFKRELRG